VTGDRYEISPKYTTRYDITISLSTHRSSYPVITQYTTVMVSTMTGKEYFEHWPLTAWREKTSCEYHPMIYVLVRSMQCWTNERFDRGILSSCISLTQWCQKRKKLSLLSFLKERSVTQYGLVIRLTDCNPALVNITLT